MSTGQITFLGHSTIRLRLPDERVIFIDPWLTGNPACPAVEKKQPRCDYILLTHGHADHTGEVPALVQQFKPYVLTNYDLMCTLASLFPGGRYEGMNLGGSMAIDGITFSMTRAYHSSSHSDGKTQTYAGMPGGFVVAAPNMATVYHAGDTDVFGDMKLIEQLHQPKILLLPIGDRFTMGPRGAAVAARFFSPAAIIPIHYGTFPMLTGTVEAFKQELGPELAQRVIPLSPGQSAQWTDAGAVLL